jgi:hypothetical protein
MVERRPVVEVLRDAFERVHELVGDLTDGLTDEVAFFRPDPDANSVCWLLWHLTRVQDDHIADAAGAEQVWPRWRAQFSLPFAEDDTGYGHSPDQVGQTRVGGTLLAQYHADVHEQTLRYVESLTAEELDRVVDTRWDPPVTVAVRLVSVVSDCLQHLGQAGYARGLAERAELGGGASAGGR